MKKEIETLRRIEGMIGPKHLFILPEWADPVILDRLLKLGYLNCLHHQRDADGLIHLIMGMELTESGRKLVHPPLSRPALVARAAMAMVGFTVLNVAVLFWG